MIAEQDQKKDESLEVKLGNLQPGKLATLKITIVSRLDIIGGHYAYVLPAAFYPNYQRYGL